MKILFSEYKSDYKHYIFPYAIWAFPEQGETPEQFFNQGFLPSARDLSRYYLCRQIRICLKKFKPNSENRRILRKGDGIDCTLVARANFDYTPEKRQFYKTYADIRFGKDVMTFEKLDNLFNSEITSHLLVFADQKTAREVGVVTLFLDSTPPHPMVYYYFAFYDLNLFNQNIGMFMMTRAAEFFAEEKFEHIYLGSCYSRNALYKFQFESAEFFNGFRWSDNLKELKHLIRRDQEPVVAHLLESDDYRHDFCGDASVASLGASGLQVKLSQ